MTSLILAELIKEKKEIEEAIQICNDNININIYYDRIKISNNRSYITDQKNFIINDENNINVYYKKLKIINEKIDDKLFIDNLKNNFLKSKK
jgi:hypothetical protein